MTRLDLAGLFVGCALASLAPAQGKATKIDPAQFPELDAAKIAEIRAKLKATQGKDEQGSEQGKKKPKAIKATPMRLLAAGTKRKPPTQAELEARFEKKMGEAWVQNADWITDYDKARSEAKQSGKLIFAYFTRSYAP